MNLKASSKCGLFDAFCMQCNYELSIKEFPQILHIKGSFDIIFKIGL